MKRLLVPLMLALLLAAPAVAEAKVEKYEGNGIKTKAMSTSFFLKNGKALKWFAFRDIPMFCGDGVSYAIDGRRFGEAVRLNRRDRFKARGVGRFDHGREVAHVKGRVRIENGRARGVLRVRAERKNGDTCRSGKQTWRAAQV